MYIETLVFILTALVLGILIDNIFNKLQDTFASQLQDKTGNAIFGFTHLITIIAVFFILQKYYPSVTDNLQFNIIYFSIHLNMLVNFSKLLEF